MPPKIKLVLCKELVKDKKTLEPTHCNSVLEIRCPNRATHIMKYRTGFCENKDCEGTARKTRTGKPRRTCDWWLVCPCDCHTTYDRMFTMSEMPRRLVDNSGYSPDHGDFVMPTVEERVVLAVLSTPNHASVPIILESPAPALVPATMSREYTPTPTGRAAPGELESWVKKQCDVWLVEEEPFACTPIYLSIEIGRAEGIKEPSVGAISAVFERWIALGFATILKKPTRFIEYTPDGITLGLEGLKDKVKRQRKNHNAQMKRGVLR